MNWWVCSKHTKNPSILMYELLISLFTLEAQNVPSTINVRAKSKLWLKWVCTENSIYLKPYKICVCACVCVCVLKNDFKLICCWWKFHFKWVDNYTRKPGGWQIQSSNQNEQQWDLCSGASSSLIWHLRERVPGLAAPHERLKIMCFCLQKFLLMFIRKQCYRQTTAAYIHTHTHATYIHSYSFERKQELWSLIVYCVCWFNWISCGELVGVAWFLLQKHNNDVRVDLKL
jgi:hypothetical protein